MNKKALLGITGWILWWWVAVWLGASTIIVGWVTLALWSIFSSERAQDNISLGRISQWIVNDTQRTIWSVFNSTKNFVQKTSHKIKSNRSKQYNKMTNYKIF